MRKFLGFHWTINYPDDYTEVTDKAATVFISFVFVDADVRCHESGGRCYTTGSPCDGRYKTGLCGGQDRQCCIRSMWNCFQEIHGFNFI